MDTIYKLNDRKVFKHSHVLTFAINNLNTVASDIFYILISQIKNEDLIFNKYKISITELEKVMSNNGNKTRINRQTLHEAAKALMNKQIEVFTDKEDLYAHWFETIIVNREKGFIEVKISDTLKDHLLKLEKYVKGDLHSFLKLRSSYSKVLYVMLCKDLNMKTNSYTLTELYEILGVSDSLKKIYSNFKNRALQTSIDEINEKTDLTVNYEQIKMGRTIDSIKFNIKKKRVKKDQGSASGVNALEDWLQESETEEEIIDVEVN